jgi:nitroimidazol reductase NimA-like FMN-containing flavoprotein (pyridoxamine 5'-phosphate oxidase superfamily)
VDRTIEELTTAECHELLERHHLGRLAFLDQVGVMPMIIPVNYLMHTESVVFRTDPGSKLTAALHGAPVAFEIDSIDARERLGWSVVVRGHVEEVTDPTDREALEQTPLRSWAPGAKPHYVRVNPRLVTGRRIDVAALPSHWWG